MCSHAKPGRVIWSLNCLLNWGHPILQRFVLVSKMPPTGCIGATGGAVPRFFDRTSCSTLHFDKAATVDATTSVKPESLRLGLARAHAIIAIVQFLECVSEEFPFRGSFFSVSVPLIAWLRERSCCLCPGRSFGCGASLRCLITGGCCLGVLAILAA